MIFLSPIKNKSFLKLKKILDNSDYHISFESSWYYLEDGYSSHNFFSFNLIYKSKSNPSLSRAFNSLGFYKIQKNDSKKYVNGYD